MYLLVGLGNPGSEYEATRHNAGWMALDVICEKYGFASFKKKGKSQIAEGEVDGQKCIAVKPQTYMNVSGEAVQPLMAFYKVALKNIIVLHDELAIPTATVKVKQGGGAAGHNGLKSLDQHIGQDYWRVRIGIDHPGDKDLVTGYVLRAFKKDERKMIDALNVAIASGLPLLLQGNPSQFIEKIRRLSAASANYF